MKRLLLILVLVVGVSCGGDDEGDQYDSQIRENFLSSCEESSDGATEKCECILEGLEERMSQSEFLSFEQDIIEGDAELMENEEVKEAFEECE